MSFQGVFIFDPSLWGTTARF